MSATAVETSLLSATTGFEHLFSNRMKEAREQLSEEHSPFHLLGLGVCSFLEAALGMEAGLMPEATRCLSLSEAEAKKQIKVAKSSLSKSQFQPGTEFEILVADAVVLQGLTHALSESYMGYLQCLYALNSAHSKFTKLYKTVFPSGLDSYITPATTPLSSRNPSTPSLVSSSSLSVSSPSPRSSSFFKRWTSSSTDSSRSSTPAPAVQPQGPVEELVVSGAAFGYGLFNLVFSLLPAGVKTVVGFLGFQHDRKLALQALAVSAARKDVHSIFAGLALMTYHGVVLLLAGFQADEAHIVKQYKAIVENVSGRFPDGSLWILNRAKILRMTYDPDGAISVLKDGLRPERPGHFVQADALLVFELAWTLLSQRRYQESAEMFLRMTEVNSWSHATYYMIAAGCFISLNDREKAKELLDKIPDLLEKRKIGGKDLPTEVFIKKKIAFYKDKQTRRGGRVEEYVESIKISPAEELAIFWNTHARTTSEIAVAHIRELSGFTPPVSITSEYTVDSCKKDNLESNEEVQALKDDLDSPDELAVRSLLLGITHRVLGDFKSSREFLQDAYQRQLVLRNCWIGGVSLFEQAVLDLKEVEAREKETHSTPNISAVPLLAPPPTPSSAASTTSSSNSSTSASTSTSSSETASIISSTSTSTGPTGSSTGKQKASKFSNSQLRIQSEFLSLWSTALKSASEKLDRAMAISGSSVDLSSRLDSRVNMLRDEIGLKRAQLGLPLS